MPSTSKSQQKLFGWALACKNGDTDNCPANVKKLADSMSKQELEDYASTKHEGLPDHVEESIVECISEMDDETLAFLKESTLSIPPKGLKATDSGDTEDNKVKMPTDITPDAPPGYVHADKRKDPGFFTPSLFKRPGDTKVKSERRIMDFPEFLKRINYATHDDTLQKGHGQNLTGGK
jgi:hypothetical protein